MSRAYEINDDQYPFTAVALIRSTWKNGQVTTGTGFIVGNNDVLTAAHVIYSGSRGGDAVRVEVIPSYDPEAGNNRSFFASGWLRYTDFDPNFDGRLISGDFRTITQAGAEKDIALLTVPGGINVFGTFGIDYRQYSSTFQVENAGYPGVYGLQPTYDIGTVTGSSVDNIYFNRGDLDVNPGNSGGPIFYQTDSGPFAIALVSTGVAFTSLSGHAFWLRDAMRANDGSGSRDAIAEKVPNASGVGRRDGNPDTFDWIDADREMHRIRDFDGNDLGGASGWRRIGAVDVQNDGSAEIIYVNSRIGRWATLDVAPNGVVDFGDHGTGGGTRVVGIYIDPLVELGIVQAGSDFDSQRRFQNDLYINNLSVITSDDYDNDGFAEVYFATRDGTAYLRALMHADGNIQYANYQNESQVTEYLTANGVNSNDISAIIDFA